MEIVLNKEAHSASWQSNDRWVTKLFAPSWTKDEPQYVSSQDTWINFWGKKIWQQASCGKEGKLFFSQNRFWLSCEDEAQVQQRAVYNQNTTCVNINSYTCPYLVKECSMICRDLSLTSLCETTSIGTAHCHMCHGHGWVVPLQKIHSSGNDLLVKQVHTHCDCRDVPQGLLMQTECLNITISSSPCCLHAVR